MYCIDNIIENHLFKENLEKNAAAEKDRKFCRHGLQHSLDVARIAYIINLEDSLGFQKEIIYATALLHDIMKWKQYEDGTPHDIAGAETGKRILEESGFTSGEAEMCVSAILHHRNKDSTYHVFTQLMYKADKLSRSCFLCAARDECKWDDTKINKGIRY